MDDNDAYKFATITFRQPLGVRDFRTLAKSLSVNLNCRVNYAAEEGLIVEKGRDQKTSACVEGMMARVKEGELVTLPFESFRVKDRRDCNYVKFDGIRFVIPPGYDLDEIARKDRLFMDEVRAIAEDYRPRPRTRV